MRGEISLRQLLEFELFIAHVAGLQIESRRGTRKVVLYSLFTGCHCHQSLLMGSYGIGEEELPYVYVFLF